MFSDHALSTLAAGKGSDDIQCFKSQSKTTLLRSSRQISKNLNDEEFARVSRVVAKACTKRQPSVLLTPYIRNFDRGNHSKASEFIAKFVSGKNPIGISYDGEFLHSGPSTPQGPAGHDSLIVGTRWDPSTRSCEFKLRNSWGLTCKNGFDPYYQKRCSQGQIWISETDSNDRVEAVNFVRVKK